MGRKRTHCVEGRTLSSLERVVTTLVEAGLQDPAAAPPNLIERLRHLQRNAVAAGGDRQILQVIASGRRLLGDGLALTGPGAPTDPGMVEAPPAGAPLRDAAVSADGPDAERPDSSAGTTNANELIR